MATQAAGVFGVGVEPPPESTDPRPLRDQRRVVRDGGPLRLGHLPDLLGERHPPQQVGDAPLHGQPKVVVRQPV